MAYAPIGSNRNKPNNQPNEYIIKEIVKGEYEDLRKLTEIYGYKWNHFWHLYDLGIFGL
jgi:hypothetical protein